MSPETYNHVSVTSSEKLDEMAAIDRHLRRELAAETVRAEMANMEAAGKVLQITDEEIRLLRSFRRFKATCKAGSVFKWQTRPTEGVTITPENAPAMIYDPQEVA